MAWIGEAGAKNINVSANVGAEIRSVSRDGTSVYFEYRPYIYQSTNTWSSNVWALWAEGNRWVVKDRSQSTKGTKYYGGWVGKSVSLGTGTNSCTISVGTQGNNWDPWAPGYVDLPVYDLPTASAPSLSGLTVTSVGDKSARVYFSVTSTNNASISDNYIDLSLSNFGAVVKSAGNRDNTFGDLDPNRTYYARGNAANAAGRTYTNVVGFTTGFNNPGNPGQPYLSCDQSEPIPKARLSISWTAATAGSTAIGGYRIRLYKNGTEIKMIDTDNANTTYDFGTFESNGFAPGDVASVNIFAYCRDWNNGQHWSGNGSTAVQGSNTITVVSDKYIYASPNGGNFNKYKMYVSANGGDFIEVKKEKFKVIK